MEDDGLWAALYGVTTSPLQAWAGWWCGQGSTARLQLLACVGSACAEGVAMNVLQGISGLWPSLISNQTEHIDTPRLRAVWSPHIAELWAVKP